MTVQPLVRQIKAALPWWSKIAAKLLLARLPVPYRVWKRIGLFEHGSMEIPASALRVFRSHLERSGFELVKGPIVVLELGPGDSIFGGLAARALGAEKVYLVDVGAYARIDVRTFDTMRAYLESQGLDLPAVALGATAEAQLADHRIVYLTDGRRSLKGIPDGSVDLAYSQAVLEHIRRAEFAPLMRELRRILKPTGVCSHVVDLQDHLGGALNNLRFGERLWESGLVARSGFYTNRLRCEEILDIFRGCGFSVELSEVQRWAAVPIPRRALHAQFRGFADDELRIRGFTVLLRPA